MARMLGRYELLQPLARGGMAEVYLGRRRGPGGVEKRLAIKRIRRERADDPRFLDLFLQEARLSMSFAHKNIAQVFDFGRAGDELFLVMEYVEGSDLGAALEWQRASDGPLEPVLVAYLGIEACNALDYAHNATDETGQPREVVHRDVTPRNVLLSRAGEVKLVDFGVATAQTMVSELGRVRGTPAYMSPEQARADAVDGRSDLFSLGLILWEALAARRAYPGKAATEVLKLARVGEIPPLPDHVPPTLAEAIACSLAPDREQRFESARSMQRALDRYLVQARADAPEAESPTHRLGAWVASQSRGSDDPATGTASAPDISTPSGSVVTFLEDGAGDLSTFAALAGGEGTIRSMAATMVETVADLDEGVQELATEPRADHGIEQPAEPARRRRARWLLAAAAAGSVAVVAVLFAGSGAGKSGAQPSPPPDAAPDAPRADPGQDAALQPGTFDAGAVTPDAGLGRRPALHAEDAGRPELPTAHLPGRGIVDAAPGGGVGTGGGTRSGAASDGALGTVRVLAEPWAAVEVRGTEASCAETPCDLQLPPGQYKLILRNPISKLGGTAMVEVVAGKQVKLRVPLTADD